jgi:hypothetical protein
MDLHVRRLLAQAQLFDDPAAYEAGVRDALDVLRADRPDADSASPAPAHDERIVV